MGRLVDFNNESTVAQPPGEIVKIVVLERREQVIEALEDYYRAEAGDIDTQHKLMVVRARVMALWFQLQAMAKRRLKKSVELSYDDVEAAVLGAKRIDDLVDVFKWFNEFIDDLGLTYIDSRARYDRTNIEDANTKKGL